MRVRATVGNTLHGDDRRLQGLGDELDVGHDLGSTPQTGKEEDRRDLSDREAPPDPVGPDPLIARHAGDEDRRVGGKGGSDNGGTGDNPRQ